MASKLSKEETMQKRREYLNKMLFADPNGKVTILRKFYVILTQKGGDIMKNVSAAVVTNTLLFALLVLSLMILLAVSRVGIEVDQKVTPRVLPPVKVVVTATPFPTATPSAFLRTPTSASKAAK